MAEIPILFQNKNECCGCSACEAACPRNCISMVADCLGFFYPQIDCNECISCFKCIKVCPLK